MRNELARIKGLATDIALMADDFPVGVVIDQLGEMAQEIVEVAGKLLKDAIEAERAEILAEQLRV